VLLLFVQKPVLTTQEICERLGMPRSTAYRYLSSLRSYALITEDNRGSWRLGPQIFPLARAARVGNSIIDLSADILNDLHIRMGETVSLYERIGHESILLTSIETQHRIRAVHPPGQILPWPGAASAKVLLAFASAQEQASLLALMAPVPYTPTTVTTEKELRAVLKKIQLDGYAYSDQERYEGVRGIAAPVRCGGQFRHCITVSGPAFRIGNDRIETMIAAVKDAAQALSTKLEDAGF
jgi:DNA-binding IclR family transcriptional regulator